MAPKHSWHHSMTNIIITTIVIITIITTVTTIIAHIAIITVRFGTFRKLGDK